MNLFRLKSRARTGVRTWVRTWVRTGAVVTALAAGCALAAPTAAQAGRTHLVGIGVCPPWKGMPASVCSGAVQDVTTALAGPLGVPPADIHTLLNADATGAGVARFLGALDTGPDDRVVLYLVLHNGSGSASRAASAEDDVMVFWSEDDPGVIEFAIAEGKWMRGADFAQLVHGIDMAELIVIFDACESGALATEVYHVAAGPGVAVSTVASAQPGQLANLDQDETRPLFSRQLVGALQSAPSLRGALDSATRATVPAARAICDQRKDYMEKNVGHEVNCDQVPVLTDPSGLLPAS